MGILWDGATSIIIKVGDILFEDAVSEKLDSLKDRRKIKRIKKDIHLTTSSFKKRYDDSSIDTRVFSKFLNENFRVKNYYKDLFWNGESGDSEEELQFLVSEAAELLSEDRKSKGLSILNNHDLLEEYFFEIRNQLQLKRTSYLSLDNRLLASQMKENFREVIKEENKLVLVSKVEKEYEQIGIRTYIDGTEKLSEECSHFLDLSDYFSDGNIIVEDAWNSEIIAEIREFSYNKLESNIDYSLNISAVQSVAFTIGYYTHSKSNKTVFPIQNHEVWDWSSYQRDSAGEEELNYKLIENTGENLIITIDLMNIGLSESIKESYSIEKDSIFKIKPKKPDRRYVIDAEHCAKLLYEIDGKLQALGLQIKSKRWKFAIAAPNAFVFILGQHATQYGKVTLLHHNRKTFKYQDSIVLS